MNTKIAFQILKEVIEMKFLITCAAALTFGCGAAGVSHYCYHNSHAQQPTRVERGCGSGMMR